MMKTPILSAALSLCFFNVTLAEQQDLTVKEAFAKMNSTYSALKKYQDKGVVTSTIITKDATITKTLNFETSFKRGGDFKFEYKSADKQQNKYTITMVDGKVHSEWTLVGGVKKPEPSLNMAIAAATGVSDGSSHTITRLLLPNEITGWSLTELQQAKINKAENGGTYVISGKSAHQDVTITLDSKSFMVLKIHENYTTKKMQVHSVTVYDVAEDKGKAEANNE